MHPRRRKKQVTPGWAGEQKGRHAPRKKEKASRSEVSYWGKEKVCTAEEGKSKLLRGGVASRREGMYPGRRKKQVTPGCKVVPPLK